MPECYATANTLDVMYHVLERFRIDRYFSTWLILLIDLAVSVLASVASVVIVGLAAVPRIIEPQFMFAWAAGAALFSGIMFVVFRTYRSIIRHSTLREIGKICIAAFGKAVLLCFAMLIFAPHQSLGIKVGLPLFDYLTTICALVLIRVAMILAYDVIKSKLHLQRRCRRVLVYGIGDKSVSLVTRLQNSPHYKVVGFLTHGRQLRGHMLAELPVYYFEEEESLEYLRDRFDIDDVLFAVYADAQTEQERLIKYCTECGLKILVAPPIDEVIDGKIMKSSIREIKIEDLLGRPEIKISMDEIVANFRGKTVMVTGAAGSIGSELCRQLATFGIRRLVMFDNAETPMHNIRLELEERFPDLKFVPVIGDVRIPARLDFVFRTYHPQVVFHAAAYKHVPLMEENPCEAVLVNVAGSRNVADKCIEYDVEKMVMISTDKAVNPTNIMGCTKRLAEIYVQSLGLAIDEGKAQGKTRFVTTRFGNVLGSNGSVIPRFREQIAKGGPVTVTHPDITRFFMTIPEACRLVMEAATMSTGNQIFVFDMGQSVKIAHLAKRMIELAGFEVDKDIKIEYTGLRPGEKLYEEVLSNTENTLPTEHDRIRIAKVREYDHESACAVTHELERLSRAVEIPDMVRLMKRTVPEFKSKNSRFEEYDKEFIPEQEAI